MASSPILSAPSLHTSLHLPGLRILDVRTRHGKPEQGRSLYAAGHIPGAIHIDLETDLSAAHGPGRHPLPTPSEFTLCLAHKGIAPEHHVVCYDDVGGAIASRLWWMAEHVGIAKVQVLDGGFPAWTEANYATETDLSTYPEGHWPLASAIHPTVNRSHLLSREPHCMVLDARSAERYRGEEEPIDSVAGHIPGAISAPFSENLSNGFFRSPEHLRSRFEALGVQQDSCVIHSCGSGVTACHNLLAMRIAGYPTTTLYPGSWSDWSSAGLPIATGPLP